MLCGLHPNSMTPASVGQRIPCCHFSRFLSHTVRQGKHPSWQTISGELSGRDEMRHLKRWASSLGHTCAPQHPPQLPFPSNIWSSLLGISQSSRPVFESLATQTAREKFTGVVYKPGAEVRSLLGVCSSSLQPWTLGKQVDKKPVVLLSHLKTWTSGT